MKVSLAQINPIVGDLAGNRRKVLENLGRAEKERADIVVFPELTVTGYPPRDLLDHAAFVEENLDSLEQIAAETGRTAAVVGFVDREKTGRFPGLLNAAALLHRGRVVSVHYKSLLPTYDVFDEVRYFSPAATVSAAVLGNTRIGISVCEDAWNDESFWSTRRYTINPIAELVKRESEFLVNISASPYVFGKRDRRAAMLSRLARNHNRALVFVNQVGGNDELVCDGHSALFGPDGRTIAQAAGFKEDFLTVRLDERAAALEVAPEDISHLWAALVLGLHDYVTKSGFTKAVVGLSGGVDSAVTACIAAEALGPRNVRGLSMPSPYSSEHSIDDARTLAENLGIRFETIRIDDAFAAFGEALKPLFAPTKPDITEENLQARIRGALLMAVSNKFDELVLATGNKSELAVGYCTLYGDMCGGLAVIGDVPKTKVYELAAHINREKQIIPESTLAKAPSAELKPNQTDQDTLPAYDVLDGILKAWVEDAKDVGEIIAMGFDKPTVRKVIHMVTRSEFKRKQAAPVIKVTTKAFGTGRRMPLVQKWE